MTIVVAALAGLGAITFLQWVAHSLFNLIRLGLLILVLATLATWVIKANAKRRA